MMKSELTLLSKMISMNWLLRATWDILRKKNMLVLHFDLASGLLFSLTSNSVQMHNFARFCNEIKGKISKLGWSQIWILMNMTRIQTCTVHICNVFQHQIITIFRQMTVNLACDQSRNKSGNIISNCVLLVERRDCISTNCFPKSSFAKHCKM